MLRKFMDFLYIQEISWMSFLQSLFVVHSNLQMPTVSWIYFQPLTHSEKGSVPLGLWWLWPLRREIGLGEWPPAAAASPPPWSLPSGPDAITLSFLPQVSQSTLWILYYPTASRVLKESVSSLRSPARLRARHWHTPWSPACHQCVQAAQQEKAWDEGVAEPVSPFLRVSVCLPVPHMSP